MTAEMKPVAVEEEAAAAKVEAEVDEKKTEEPKLDEEDKKEEEPSPLSVSATVERISSFREESYFLKDLKESEKKALSELRANIEEAILENKLFKKEQQQEEEPKPKEKGDVNAEEKPEEKEDLKSEEKPEEKEDVKAEELSKEKEDVEAEEPPKEETGEGDEKAKFEDDVTVKNAEEPAAAEENAVKTSESEANEAEQDVIDKDISLWGVPLLPSKGLESTNIVLLKFLRARDFKVKEALEMLQNTLLWRKESRIDSILDEELLGADIGVACYMDGVDREGHPVCYNVPGFFKDEQLYQKTFGTDEGREQFLRWRVQIMEKGIKKLDFKPDGVVSLLQITDLKDSPGPSKKELRSSMRQVVQLLQDNYPEFVARNVFINVPFWYYAFNALLSPFLTQRTRSKFVFARPAKVAETLLKYIPAEAIPIKYGGLKRDNDSEFSPEEGGVLDLVVKASSIETIEIPAPKAGTTLLWDLTVLGWEVNYKEEFVPTDEGSYTIIVQKGKKMGSQEEPVRNSFRNQEPGKVILTIENNTFRKKKVLYRYKTKSS